MNASDKTQASVLTKLDTTLDAITKERTEMAEQRGTLNQFKVLIPILTGLVGFMGGALVTLMVAHIL